MKSYELVAKTIKGQNDTGITPIYGWVRANLTPQICERFKSVENFEDEYEFDMHHIFGGPVPYDLQELGKLRAQGVEITPDVVLDMPMLPVNNMDDYKSVLTDLKFYREDRERFCYMQSHGMFECLNSVFGIEDHLCYLALYPDEMKELYERQAVWNIQFENNMMDLGVDMIHISDDWGAQRSLMFSPKTFKELIVPAMKKTTEAVKKRNCFLSLHSDGCVKDALDDVVDMGFDVIHPWQETAGMDYETYLNKYSDKFGILGGVCIQSVLGFNDYERLEREIRRVFGLLKGKRWICCTTHYVQDHCSIDELVFAFDLIKKLAGKSR